MINFRYYTYFFTLVVFFELSTYLLSIIRLAHIFNTTLVTRFFVVIPSIVVIFILLHFIRRIRFDLFFIFLVTLLIHGLNMALLHWTYTDATHYQVYYVISETSMILFAACVYLFILNIDFRRERNYQYLQSFFNTVSFYIVLINTMTIIIGNIMNTFTNYHLYLSISGKFLLIPLAWYTIHNRQKAAFYTFMLILLGGKFGVLVAALVMLVVMYKFKRGFSSVLFFIFTLTAIMLFIGILYLIKDYHTIGIIDKINSNYNFFNIDPDNLIMFAGGRFIELFSVFDHFTIPDYLWGKGIGYEYLNIQSGTNFIHNVHITPFGLISKFGIFFTVILYGSILFYLFKGSSQCKEDKIYIFFKSILIGMLVFSLTEYAFFVNLTIWISLGYIANRSKLCVA